MAFSKAIIKMKLQVGDRIKVPGKDAFTFRPWEPGTIIEIEYGTGLFGTQMTGVALIRFDNPNLGNLSWGIGKLRYEHTEEELVEQVLGDYFG